MPHPLILFSLLIVIGYFQPVFADEISVPTVIIDQEGTQIEEKIDGYSIFKTENISKKTIQDPKKQSLSEIVKDQAGVSSDTYCANCGAKRLTINGLKGEHTSILIDGLPLHSAVSSSYGVDNIPANGISEVQVMRGAGASLTNPEAIGGTLNVITTNPLDSTNQISTSISVDDKLNGQSQNYGLIYGWTKPNKKFGVLFGGQYSKAETWDVDENNISESPQRENYSVMLKTRFSLGKKNDISFRYSLANLEILGGFADPIKPLRVRPLPAQESDFEDGNVEKKYIGDPMKITDWIRTNRNEGALSYTHYLNSKSTLEFKMGHARQKQEAIYQHGFDYANIDNMFVADANYKYNLSPKSILTTGLFYKDQRLRSASATLYAPAGTVSKDDFNLSSLATYLQYSYFLPELFELDIALRLDSQKINWLDLTNEVDKTILAPRLQLLHHLSSQLKQRLSYGLGYRLPLTFFESQHGNNEGGYEVDINDLEKAHSLVYSLSWNTPTSYITFGAHYTYLENMAYGFERLGGTTLYRNSEESYNIFVFDLLAGHKPSSWLFIEAGAEFFTYEDEYKRRLPTAAIEQRYQLKSTIEQKNWSHSLAVNLIGARDISKYGSYNEHYVERNQGSEPILDTSLELKDQKSPAYVTVDTSFNYNITKKIKLGLSIENIFNYTQTKSGDSPASWHWHFNHAHYDGLHTWGPNTGRQFFLNLKSEL